MNVEEDDIDPRGHDLPHAGPPKLNDLREDLCFDALELSDLARAGFAQVAIYGDFDRSPVGRGSPALVVVAS